MDDLPGLLAGEAQFGQQREQNVPDYVRLALSLAGPASLAGLLGRKIPIAAPQQPAVSPVLSEALFHQAGRSQWPMLGLLAGVTGTGGYGAYKVAEMMAERERQLKAILDAAK
jgi:hypothetical protein